MRTTTPTKYLEQTKAPTIPVIPTRLWISTSPRPVNPRPGGAERSLCEIPGRAGKGSGVCFICYIDANYVAKSSIQGIDEETIMGHHGVGIFWNITEWTIEE